MQFFRNFFKTKVGLAITMAFLVLIAIAFASSDVANTGTFGGIAGGDRVAVVGDERINTADLTSAVNTALDQARRENPTLTMEQFIAQGGLDQVTRQLVSRTAISGYAQDLGLRAGDNLVNSEIRNIPAFRGPSGAFDTNLYQTLLRQQGLTDAQVRDDLRAGLLAQQLVRPASFGASVPQSLARRYAALFKERRQGGIAFLPSAAFAPSAPPTDAQLRDYYASNRADYIRPERRAIRYAVLDSEAITDRIEPTAAAIQNYYQENASEYAASEERSFEQVIAPSEEVANRIRQQAAGGASLGAAAREAGLRAVELRPIERDALRSQASEQVAQAYFTTARGALTPPARSSLGWHVARVTDVEAQQGRSLEQVRDEIATLLRDRNRQQALSDLSAEVEDQLATGSSLAETARALGLSIETTGPLTADGQVYGTGETAPALVQPAIATAFQMSESDPQVAEVERGETFLLFEVARITEAATAPLAEIREQVAADWRQARGQAAAREAAEAILARVREGAELGPTARDVSSQVEVQQVDLTREQLAQQANRRIPPPLALMFSMAEGTAKRLEAGQDAGWYVVSLQDIEAGDVTDDDSLIAQANRALGPLYGDEYVEQLVAAAQTAQGVERNDAAIAAVRRQLLGNN